MLKKFSIFMLILITSYSCALEKEETSSVKQNYTFTVGSVSFDSYNGIANNTSTQERLCIDYKNKASDIVITIKSEGKYGSSPTEEIKNSKLKITGADLYYVDSNGSFITVPQDGLVGLTIPYNGSVGKDINIGANSAFFQRIGDGYVDFNVVIVIYASELTSNDTTTVLNGYFEDEFTIPVRLTGDINYCLK